MPLPKGYKPSKTHLKNLRAAHRSPETRERHRKAQIRNWKNPAYRKSNLAGKKRFSEELAEFRKFRKFQKETEKK